MGIARLGGLELHQAREFNGAKSGDIRNGEPLTRNKCLLS